MRSSNNELFLQYSDIKKGGTEVSFSFFCRPFIPQFGIKKITGVGGEASPGYAADVYPFSDQNGAKTLPFGAAHTYIAYIRE